MKKILYLLINTLFIITPNFSSAAEKFYELDTSEYITPWTQSTESIEHAAYRTGKDILEMYKYFNEKYPGDKLNEDFSDEVAKKYPQLTQEEARARELNIRYILGLYRNGKKIYDDIKAKLLIPEDPPLIVDAKDFDDGNFPKYIPSEKTLIINDFKKIIPYSNDIKDLKAIRAKYYQNLSLEEEDSVFYKLHKVFSKLEFSKLLDYGRTIPNPFTGNKGIGNWQNTKPIDARIITAHTSINNDGNIKGAINFQLEPGYFMLLAPTKKYSSPQISFKNSKNLEKFELSWLMPTRLHLINQNDDFVGYGNFFPVPISFKAKDSSQPLELQADINVFVCGNKNCEEYQLSPKLQINPSKYIEESDVNVYINSAFSSIPPSTNPKIKFLGAFVEHNEFSEPLLRIKYKTKLNPATFQIFVSNNHNIIFGSPQTAIRDNIITFNIPILTPNTKLEGKEITICAGNYTQSIQHTTTISSPSIFDNENKNISLGIILLAITGGFLLNLMPCVFPVLSLKLMSLMQFGARKEEKMRQNFIFTTIGIYTAFAIITGAIIILKSLNYTLGWGIQFQNIGFLTIMLLAILLFFAQTLGLISINLSSKSAYLYKIKSENLLSFLTGLFLVLLSTPCTAPYLGTAVGFALSGSYIDIIIIMPAIAFGLSIPYLLLSIYPQLSSLLPPPGKWMLHLSQTMSLMLFLTMLWLLSVIAAQTSTHTAIKLGIYISLLLFIIWLRTIFLNSIYQQDINEIGRKKLKIIYNLSAIILSLPILFFYFHDSFTSFDKHKQEIALKRELQIDHTEIRQKLKEGKKILVSIKADWCLTCKFNDITVLNSIMLDKLKNKYNLEMIEIDWTDYNKDILDYMEKFGRKGLPFYVLFTPKIPDGLVLPEILTENDLTNILGQL